MAIEGEARPGQAGGARRVGLEEVLSSWYSIYHGDKESTGEKAVGIMRSSARAVLYRLGPGTLQSGAPK